MGGKFAELIGKRKAFPYGFPDAKPQSKKFGKKINGSFDKSKMEDV